jgi:hypothetical protein
VAGFGGAARGATVKLAVEHDPASDARADGQHDEVADAGVLVPVQLGERRTGCVVVGEDGQSDAAGDLGGHGDVAQRDVDAYAHATGVRIHYGRHADADRLGA